MGTNSYALLSSDKASAGGLQPSGTLLSDLNY